MRIALATTRPLPEPDPDEQMTLDALRAAGFDAQTLAWNEGGDASGFDAVVLRSTWDYYLALPAFEEWLQRVASCARLFNPIEIVGANLHKRYLLELLRRGVPIVPTAMVGRGTRLDPPKGEEPTALVVKPAVGASSWRTKAFGLQEMAEAFRYVQVLAQEMDVLVQPRLASVEASGERSLVWIDGGFTHKVVKRPRYEGGDESVSHAVPVEHDERSVGECAIASYMDWVREAAPEIEPPLYARVDLMADDEGKWLVSELEMTEPSLYFLQEPRALDAFVTGLSKRLRS